jgi:uncharacterized membrane protein
LNLKQLFLHAVDNKTDAINIFERIYRHNKNYLKNLIMAKYLISRLLFVFLCKFFYNWAFNAKSHLIQFFEISEGFGLSILSYILTFLILVLGVLTLNLIFSILRLTEKKSVVELVREITDKGYAKCAKLFITKPYKILSGNFDAEAQQEKHPNLFLVFIFIYLMFIKGNPILNNYYGIYKEYESENQGYVERTDLSENQNFIVHKNNESEITYRMKHLEESDDQGDYDFIVKKRGYLFLQTGLFDGFRTYNKEYQGLFSYIECLVFSALEKLINTIMYFFIPFITCIAIYHYKLEDKTSSQS